MASVVERIGARVGFHVPGFLAGFLAAKILPILLRNAMELYLKLRNPGEDPPVPWWALTLSVALGAGLGAYVGSTYSNHEPFRTGAAVGVAVSALSILYGAVAIFSSGTLPLDHLGAAVAAPILGYLAARMGAARRAAWLREERELDSWKQEG